LKRAAKRPKSANSCEAILATGTRIHPALRDYLGYCLIKAAIRMRAGLEQSFKDYELAPPHFAILSVLNSQKPLNQLSLGEELGIDKATMVKLIDALERLGLVERTTSPEDRRAKLVSITDQGRKTLRKLLALAARNQEAFLSPLTKAETQQFKAMIMKLLRVEET
jgi:DNA-binding MarR family transcriptional regulator